MSKGLSLWMEVRSCLGQNYEKKGQELSHLKASPTPISAPVQGDPAESRPQSTQTLLCGRQASSPEVSDQPSLQDSASFRGQRSQVSLGHLPAELPLAGSFKTI